MKTYPPNTPFRIHFRVKRNPVIDTTKVVVSYYPEINPSAITILNIRVHPAERVGDYFTDEIVLQQMQNYIFKIDLDERNIHLRTTIRIFTHLNYSTTLQSQIQEIPLPSIALPNPMLIQPNIDISLANITLPNIQLNSVVREER